MAQPATQAQRLDFLLRYLLGERKEYRNIEIPAAQPEKQRLLRSLMNVAPARAGQRGVFARAGRLPAGRDKAQGNDGRCRPAAGSKRNLPGGRGTLQPCAATPLSTPQTARCWGVLCPATAALTTPFTPGPVCSFGWACAQQMQRQGREEAPGRAKITPGFNLPCRYVLHTVGPMVGGAVTRKDRELLAGCYRSCLNLAAAHGLHSVAFCCISTGEFHFPAEPGGRDCRSDGAGMAAAEPGERGGDFQCVPRQRLCNLQAPAAMRPCG